MPELLANVAIERKNPSRIIQLLHSETGKNIACHCPYCDGLNPELLVVDKLTKKHFLYRRNEEMLKLRTLPATEERVLYIKNRVEKAIGYYKNLKPIFKDDDYKFLKTWMEVIIKLQERG